MTERCCVDDCVRVLYNHKLSLCHLHYQRNRRLGTTSLPTKPSAEERFWPRVVKTEGCWNWTGALDEHGYGKFRYKGRAQYAHRVAYMLLVGEIPKGIVLDHKCHNHACVNPDPEHVRQATHKQNMENRAGPQRNSSSGILGVSWIERLQKWHARVQHQRKTYHVGTFATLAEAEAAVIAKRNQLFTHNALDKAA